MYTHDPLGWDDFLHDAWGSGTYEELRTVAQEKTNPDFEAIIAGLKEELAR
jgi:hypothetical protein